LISVAGGDSDVCVYEVEEGASQELELAYGDGRRAPRQAVNRQGGVDPLRFALLISPTTTMLLKAF